jgi:hypothetical protein
MIESKLIIEKEIKEPEISYPFLGVADDGVVVLFTSHGVGTIVHTPEGHMTVNHLGEHSRTCEMSCFRRLNIGKTVHLTNKD